MGWSVTYGIKVIAQLEIGEHAEAHRGRHRGCWVLREGDCDVSHYLSVEKIMYLYEICSF
jgi:hypothetical protein